MSIVLPARNEGRGLQKLLPGLNRLYSNTEILVVDDGSTDDTAAVCRTHNVRVVSHPNSLGKGAAIKTGARVARGDLLVLLDAAGQYDPKDIEKVVRGRRTPPPRGALGSGAKRIGRASVGGGRRPPLGTQGVEVAGAGRG